MFGGESKHEFAIYVPNLGSLRAGISGAHQCVLTDPALVHRIHAVLRLEPGESVILFDRQIRTRCVIRAVSKKEIPCVFEEKQKNIVLQPDITFFLPVLKKEDLESALYCLVELGANHVQLVATEKTRHAGNKERAQSEHAHKEFERLERIMIAAAEQSKQFALPELRAPISFDQAIKQFQKTEAFSIFFDPEGQDLFTVMTDLRAQKPHHLFLLVGPEGDLTAQEKALLANAKVLSCRLTPTVLRSVQAVAVGMGVVRSVV